MEIHRIDENSNWFANRSFCISLLSQCCYFACVRDCVEYWLTWFKYVEYTVLGLFVVVITSQTFEIILVFWFSEWLNFKSMSVFRAHIQFIVSKFGCAFFLQALPSLMAFYGLCCEADNLYTRAKKVPFKECCASQFGSRRRKITLNC